MDLVDRPSQLLLITLLSSLAADLAWLDRLWNKGLDSGIFDPSPSAETR